MTDHDAHGGGHGNDDTTGVHGMLLFGEDDLYLSHLPMFMTPHNFQVLLEAGFDDAVREVLGAGGLHTFEPEVFAITELDPGGDGPARAAIEGTIFRGHFERGGPRSPRASPRRSAGSSTSPSSTSRRAMRPTRR